MAEQVVFVSRMRAIDSVTVIDDVDRAVRSKLRAALPQGQRLVLRQVWAWWHEQTVAVLRKRMTSVSVDHSHHSDQRSQAHAFTSPGRGRQHYEPSAPWSGCRNTGCDSSPV
ncbi:hypothetical protein [Streptomyces sp. NBC_00258]|uniref:hypothetical protein n=1 Tax=Streptomyces sp. NBC_00258 TaxID=2903642 RepID=UPI002E2CC731|nr:hypothetical protein [Streptomyces sp. NBC_00258]